MKKRKEMVEQLFDFWDVDRSGVLNFQEVNEVLSQWKDISAEPQFLECKCCSISCRHGYRSRRR